MKKVYIVLLNWNGWADTIECLDSLLRLNYGHFQIIVVDNASTDSSVERIKAWAEGRLTPIRCGTAEMEAPVFGGHHIELAEYGQAQSEMAGIASRDNFLTLIKADENRGFAAGNNIALKHILARQDADYVWLLNNDTVVIPDALDALVSRMREDASIGMCGSSLLFYDKPSHVQVLAGGYYCRWLAVVWHLGQRRRFAKPRHPHNVERHLSYVVGASMMVSMKFLEDVGLMAEDYFLYFEEMDWTLRAGKRFKLAYAPDSIVYHKVGRAIGTSSHPGRKSLVCDYYNLRNRLLFTRRYFPYALPTVYLGLVAECILRAVFLRWESARMAFSILLGTAKPPQPTPVKVDEGSHG